MGGGGVPELFAQLTQAIMQAGLTPEVMSAFEEFMMFMQQVAQQAAGGQAQAPAQAPGPPMGGPPQPGGPMPAG